MNFTMYVIDYGNFWNKLFETMSRSLTLKDFQWIVTNDEKADGYYSLKREDWEIAIDWTYRRSWTVSVCNKFEEALEEYGCANEEQALKIANKIYHSFTAN